MKKLFFVAAAFVCGHSIQAQTPQPPKPPTIEERIKKVHDGLSKKIQLNDAQAKAVEAAYKDFFVKMDKLRPKDPPPPPPPPVKKEDADRLSQERDAKIKAALTEEQYKQYIEVEKTLRPKHPERKDGNQPPPVPPKE